MRLRAFSVEAAFAHEATFPSRRMEYGPVLASVLDAGRAMSGLAYREVLLRRMAFRGRMKALFIGIDLPDEGQRPPIYTQSHLSNSLLAI
jgi:hypothetical protein